MGATARKLPAGNEQVKPAQPVSRRLKIRGKTTVEEVAADLIRNPEHRSAHLSNVCVSTLKYLALYSESDDVKLAAAQTLLTLPTVQAKLATHAKRTANEQRTHKSTRVHWLAEQLQQALRAGGPDAAVILETLSRATMPANSQDPGANAQETKESR